MKTTTAPQNWGIKSVSFWIVLTIATGIIFIGIRFIIHPQAGALGYGLPFTSPDDTAYGKIKGIRDIFSGLTLLPLLLLRMRKAVAWVFTTAIVVPAFDFFLILSYNGSNDLTHLLIHGITVLVMAVASILLFKNYSK